MKDEYATLRAAFHAGARIQAWTLREFAKSSNDGYWRLLGDNQTHEEPKFSCEPHLYRVYPEDRHLIAELGQEVGAVAYIVPVARVTSDGSYEDGPPQLCFADEADDYVRRVGAPLYTSPAHTSEARDAARSEAYDKVDRFLRNTLMDAAYAEYSDALEIACGYQDAAMRQEAE